MRDPKNAYLESIQDLVEKQDPDLASRPLGCEQLLGLLESQTDLPLAVAVNAINEVKVRSQQDP